MSLGEITLSLHILIQSLLTYTVALYSKTLTHIIYHYETTVAFAVAVATDIG